MTKTIFMTKKHFYTFEGQTVGSIRKKRKKREKKMGVGTAALPWSLLNVFNFN